MRATADGTRPPRPHLHLRPGPELPPDPPMFGGMRSFDLESGEATNDVLQHSYLASVSWGYRVAGKLFMGSPWDDGVLVCPAT